MLLGIGLGILSAARSKDEAKLAGKVPLSIFCFDYAAEHKSVRVKRGPEDLEPVKLSTANIVDAGQVVSEDGALRLYGVSAEAAEAPVLGSAKLDGLREPLMILVPAGEEPGVAYRCRAVDRHLNKFPLGSCLFVNLTPHAVRVILGEETLEIAPDTDRLVEPKVAAGEVMAVTVECRIGDHWQAVSSSRWAHREDRRSLVTLHLSPRNGRVLMKSIPLRESADAP